MTGNRYPQLFIRGITKEEIEGGEEGYSGCDRGRVSAGDYTVLYAMLYTEVVSHILVAVTFSDGLPMSRTRTE